MLPRMYGPGRRKLLWPIGMVLALAGCRPDTVDLGYSYETGTEVVYELRADAHAEWDLEGRGSGSYTVIFDVSEEVLSSNGEEATVEVRMVPREMVERGLPPPGADERTFTLRLGPGGEVVEVVEVDGVPARALDADQLAFIGTYRPPLPRRPVRLRDSWVSRQEVGLPDVFQQFTTEGELTGLDRDREGAMGLLSYAGSGPLSWALSLPQGSAELAGAAESETRATFDLDAGSLRDATSTTAGRFELHVAPDETRLPLVGTLNLEIELRVTRVGERDPVSPRS
jgi:hypothetical protein